MNRPILVILVSLLCACEPSVSTIKFEKLVFHTTFCFGTCPTYHLQLNADQSLYLHAEKVYSKHANPFSNEIDSSKVGYFIGKADSALFSKLIIELNSIGLDTINLDGPMYTDAPEIDLIIYYDGKRKYLHSSYPTPRAKRFISILYEICASSNLKRSDQSFEVERASL